MWAVLTFWLLLGLPGLAWLQRYDPASLERGGLSVVARAYFASFALLTPFSALGYLLQLPLWTMSAAIVCAVAFGAVALVRERRWLGMFGMPSVAAAVCGIWLAFDLWLGARVGSHVQGDAGFHLARIRLIGAYGFNNWDPLVSGQHFEPIYHTNLYHSLIAACAQLTGLDPGAAWIWVWPFAKLVAAAGTYELAVAVLGVRACGYVAAMTSSAWLATSSTLAFPNTFAPYALMPFALACAVDALSTPSFRGALWLGVASLVLAQTHLLYALFLALAVAPVLGLRFLDALLRRRRRRRELLATLLALALAAPWFYAPARPKLAQLLAAAEQVVSWVSTASAQDKPPPRASERAASRFLHVPPNLVRVDPTPFLQLENTDLQAAFALVVAAVVTRRRQALALAAIFGMICLWLFTPWLCMQLVKLLANWVVLRFTQLFFVVYAALVPATILRVVLLVGTWLRLRYAGASARPRAIAALRGAFEVAATTGVLAYAYHFASYGSPWTKEATWEAALAGTAQANADRITRRARFFTANIAAGATVMAPLLRDYDIPMHCPCHTVAFRKGRGEHEQADNDARRAAVEKFYLRNASSEERLELLRKYGVRYVFSGPRRAAVIAQGLAPHVRGLAHDNDDAIISVSP
jgi:hypothetical protein